MFWLNRERAVVARQRLVVLALRGQNDAKDMVRIKEVRFLRYDFLTELLRFAELARLVGRDGAVKRQR